MVGVTAGVARAARSIGEKLLKQAAELEAAQGDALTAGISALQQALADSTITLTQRHKLREALTRLQKAAKQQQKAEAADATELVLAAARELVDAARKDRRPHDRRRRNAGRAD